MPGPSQIKASSSLPAPHSSPRCVSSGRAPSPGDLLVARVSAPGLLSSVLCLSDAFCSTQEADISIISSLYVQFSRVSGELCGTCTCYSSQRNLEKGGNPLPHLGLFLFFSVSHSVIAGLINKGLYSSSVMLVAISFCVLSAIWSMFLCVLGIKHLLAVAVNHLKRPVVEARTEAERAGEVRHRARNWACWRAAVAQRSQSSFLPPL